MMETSQRPVIFLAEDNAADVELFRMALENAAVTCELKVFLDGHAILEYVRGYETAKDRAKPELIIMDLNLPKIDGVEVLRMIRNVPGFQKVPYAVISCSSSFRDRDKLAGYNIVAYIVK